MITLEVGLDFFGAKHAVTHGILCSDDELVSDTAAGCPFTEPSLALFSLIEIGSIDEVAAMLIESVEDLKSRVFFTLLHATGPSLAKVHSAEAEWRDTDTRRG